MNNEPVAWMLADKEAEHIRSIMAVQHDFVPKGCIEIPLYTHPAKCSKCNDTEWEGTKEMNDKVDLEDAITNVWAIKEDIELLIWRYIDHPAVMTEDEMWNYLAGLASVLDLRCEKLWDTYCRKFELDAYATPEKIAYRDEFLKGIVKAEAKADKATKKKAKK